MKPDKPIRLIMKSGATADVYEPIIVGDSIVGMTGPTRQATRRRIAFDTAEIRNVATHEISVGKTVLTVSAITLVAVIVYFGAALIAIATSYPKN